MTRDVVKDDDEVQVLVLAWWSTDTARAERRRRALALVMDVLVVGVLLAMSAAVLGLLAVAWRATGDGRLGWALALTVAGVLGAHLRLVEGWRQR